MKLKKILLMGLSLALVAALAIGGTLAYLTDRDSEVNTFTVGDVAIDLTEEFEQGAELLPGVKIDKNAEITNIGKNDAWVWLTVLIPKELGPYTAPENLSASNNVVHWNYPKANADNITVKFEETPVALDPDGDGENSDYYRTSLLYNNVLIPEANTGIMLSTVYMDAHIDIAPNGDWYWIKDGGDAVKLDWNSNTSGLPKLYVSAYAIQAKDFVDVNAAYAAYGNQWGENGEEYNNSVAEVSTFEELKTAFANGGTVILADDITIETRLELKAGAEVHLNMNGKTITNTPHSVGEIPAAIDMVVGSTLVIDGNGTFDMGNSAQALVYPRGDLTIENGTFIRNVEGVGNVYPLFMGMSTAGAGTTTINGGYFDGGYFDPNGVLEKFEETDVNGQGKPGDTNIYRKAIKNNIACLLNRATNKVRVYGGTFVGMNPAWGDEGCMLPTTPDYLRPWSNNQGAFLEGQQANADEIVLPAGYAISTGTTADGRPTYTVTYSK